MSFTRFNYDDCRTEKLLQESTGPGRYILNTPGWGDKPTFYNDPQIRMQKWGANLRHVPDGNAIDIHSDLIGITRKLSKDCKGSKYPNKAIVITSRIEFNEEKKNIFIFGYFNFDINLKLLNKLMKRDISMYIFF